jgi:hypothetical protein
MKLCNCDWEVEDVEGGPPSALRQALTCVIACVMYVVKLKVLEA